MARSPLTQSNRSFVFYLMIPVRDMRADVLS